MTSLWAFLLIDVSQGQVYSFAQFSNNALGIIGGVGVALAAIAFFNPPVPERQFKTTSPYSTPMPSQPIFDSAI